MKRFLYFIVIMLLLASRYSFAAEQRIVLVGVFSNFPVIFQDRDGVVKGIYADLLSEVGEKENIHFEYILDSWDGCLENIRSGRIDLLPGVGFLQERTVYSDYGKSSLITVWGELYTSKLSEIDGILDIEGKKIGVLKNDIVAINFQELVSKFDITCQFVELKTYDDIFKAVSGKKIDAGVVESTYGTAKQFEYKVRSTGVVCSPLNYYFITTKGHNADLLPLLDSYLDKWKYHEDSVLNRSKQKWLGDLNHAEESIPSWIINVLIISGIIIVVALTFILLLRKQVKKATEKISESEAHFRTLADSGQALIWTFGVNKKFDYFNLTWLNFTGRTLEQESGDGWVEGVYPDDLKRCIKTYSGAIDHRESFSLEFRLRNSAGEYRWLQNDGKPRYNSKNEYIGYIGHCLDITAYKLAEEDRMLSLNRSEKLIDSIILAMSVTVEIRDSYTAGHQKRVADLAFNIAKEMGLSDEQTKGLLMAARIHDLGKISVPAEILSMPRKLTDLEFGLIKSHPQTGYDILKDIDFSWPIARIILEHHEKYDGSGYPNGLTGANLLMESQIMTVADVVESMVSHRPYRPSLGVDAALNEIIKNSGILYNSQVVEACVKVIREKGYEFPE